MLSPSISPAQNQCLSFWYHMYGHNADTLNVYTLRNDQYNINRFHVVYGNLIWSRSQGTANSWVHATMRLSESSHFRVRTDALYDNHCNFGRTFQVIFDPSPTTSFFVRKRGHSLIWATWKEAALDMILTLFLKG